MARPPFIGAFVLCLIAHQIVPIGTLRAQVPATAGHDHLTEVACVDMPAGAKRPEYGCFNVATISGPAVQRIEPFIGICARMRAEGRGCG